MTYTVGLTGGIGSGKTVVSDHLASLGVPVIDTDVIARLIVAPGQPALQQLVAAFGSTILAADGSLERNNLRQLAFSSPELKDTLDAITHPAIRHETLAQISRVKYCYCVVVIPLLTKQSPFSKLLQRVLVVTADRETKIKRVQQRSQLSREEVERIMQTQISDQQRLAWADDVIENNASLAEVRLATEALHHRYLELSTANP